MQDPDFTYETFISFGDCHPAGIVFYPNYFALFDRCFHAWLMAFGGHAAVCKAVGARGIGLIDAGAKFKAPFAASDTVAVDLWVAAWGSRAVTLGYRVRGGDRVHVEGREVRVVFVDTPRGIVAGDARGLQALLGG